MIKWLILTPNSLLLALRGEYHPFPERDGEAPVRMTATDLGEALFYLDGGANCLLGDSVADGPSSLFRLRWRERELTAVRVALQKAVEEGRVVWSKYESRQQDSEINGLLTRFGLVTVSRGGGSHCKSEDRRPRTITAAMRLANPTVTVLSESA
ncbi:MAG: hypothetical protein PHT12_03810 [Patescibacteria group bacterium]|nr:hypothetical protein [Patescibacteria group bacterium]